MSDLDRVLLLTARAEIDRLTRELAETKERAVPSWTETKFALDAWLKKKGIFDDDSKAVFAAAAWKACWDFVRANCSANASLPDGWVAVPMEPITGENYENGLWSRRNWTAALEDMLSARPESPPNGLPSKESDHE